MRWSVNVGRKNYEQFGGVPRPSQLLDLLGDQDFGDGRPVVTTKRPPAAIKAAEKAAAIKK